MKKIVVIVLIVLLLLAIIYIVIQKKKQSSLAVKNVPLSILPAVVSKPVAIVVVEPVQAPSDITGASSTSSPTVAQLAMAAAAKRACEVKCDLKYPVNKSKRQECKAGC